MKKMIALLLALMMTLGCLQALAEEPADTAAAEAPAEAETVPAAATTTKMELSIDKEMMTALIAKSGSTEGAEGLIDSILNLVDALEITTINAGNGAQIDLGCNGKTAVSFGFAEKDGGLLIASTLFPNYLLTVPAETIQGMMPQFTPTTTGTANSTGTTTTSQSAGSLGDFIDAIRKIDPEINVALSFNKEGIILQFERGEEYFAFSIVPGENDTLNMNVYVNTADKPVATLAISEEKAGELTLSMDPEGKTLLPITELQGENAGKALEGLQTDLQMGIMQLMAVPEVASVMAAYTQMQQQMMQQMQEQTQDPQPETEEPAA